MNTNSTISITTSNTNTNNSHKSNNRNRNRNRNRRSTSLSNTKFLYLLGALFFLIIIIVKITKEKTLLSPLVLITSSGAVVFDSLALNLLRGNTNQNDTTTTTTTQQQQQQQQQLVVIENELEESKKGIDELQHNLLLVEATFESEKKIFNEMLSKIDGPSLNQSNTILLPTVKLLPFGNYTTGLFNVWPEEKQPSTNCFPAASLPHSSVWKKPKQLQDRKYTPKEENMIQTQLESYRKDNSPAAVCSGPQFTHIRLTKDRKRTLFSMDCPNDGSDNGRWNHNLNEVNTNKGTAWRGNETIVPLHNKSPGVDWVYTACTVNNTRHTNLRVHPYRLPLPQQKEKTLTPPSKRKQHSIVLIIIDSVSHGVFRRDLKETEKVFNQDFADISFIFNRTTVVGRNSDPNTKAMIDAPNLFSEATRNHFVTSVFEDYCPDYALCKHYPRSYPHRVCTELLCNYGSDVSQLYAYNPGIPGCAHGEYFINHHLRYISDFWNVVYPASIDGNQIPKFHASKTYGCHMERANRDTCQLNDRPLATFLQEFVPKHPDTAVILASDHGFHWQSGEGRFNDHVAGEYEHRNPFLGMIVPWAKNNSIVRVNTQRLVTHRDLHATLLGMLNNYDSSATKQSGPKGFDLLQQHVPEKRSCRDAQIPDAWCNCFRPRTHSFQPSLHTQEGVEATSKR